MLGDPTAARGNDGSLPERLVPVIIAEAIHLRGTEVRLECRKGFRVSYRIADEWVERDTLPMRLGRGLLARITQMAGFVAGGVSDQLGRISWTANGRQFDIEVALRIEDEGSMILLRIVPHVPEGFA